MQEAVTGMPTGVLIGGSWQPASESKQLEDIDPATERTLTTVADADEQDAMAAVAAAHAATSS